MTKEEQRILDILQEKLWFVCKLNINDIDNTKIDIKISKRLFKMERADEIADFLNSRKPTTPLNHPIYYNYRTIHYKMIPKEL